MAERDLLGQKQLSAQAQGHEFASFLKYSFLEIAKKEWPIWLVGAVLSFIGASLFMSGWPDGLLPDIKRPLTYAGDGISYMWNIKRVIEETWFFANSHTGYPFGSNHLDYPTSDTGSYAILKVLGTIFQSPVAALNLYFLIGFSFVFAASYIVLRTIDVSKIFSVVGAALYTFATFHFARIGHLFFTWYFVAPIFFYYGFKLFNSQLTSQKIGAPYAFKWLDLLALIAISSFGIYYSVFGFIVLFVSTALAALLYKSWAHFRVGCLHCAGVALGVFLNIAPSLWYLQVNGPNLEGVNRFPAESELYGLKLVQMLIPSADHRLDSFYDIAARYNNNFPLVTENISASFGSANSLGLLLLILSIFVAPMFAFDRTNFDHIGRVKNKQYIYQFMVMGLLACSLYMISTVGGFSSLFALLVSASIRSWNRISIFIEFISVAALVLSLDWFFGSSAIQKIKNQKYQLIFRLFIATLIVGYGIADETVKPCRSCLVSNAQLFEHDKAFVQKVEKSLPPGAAIYQLPYMGYPEYNAVNNLGSYDQARGHLHSNTLKWSFGGIRGREGDWFYRKLAQLPIEQQLTVVQALGFAGVYVDRRGYLNTNGDKRCLAHAGNKITLLKNDCLTANEIEQDIAAVLGHGDISAASKTVSQDKQLSFFPIQPGANLPASRIAAVALANKYLLPIGFEIVNGVPVAAGGFEEPIDLRKTEFPPFVAGVTGLSEIAENGSAPVGSAARVTGRWSDAYVAPVVKLWLAKPLPARFNLTVTARGGGPNADKPLQIKIGKQVKELSFGAEMQTKIVSFELEGKFQTIEFKPYQPFVPARRWVGASDIRKLGVEFEKVLISAK
jgi:phosphoglycerol transferase